MEAEKIRGEAKGLTLNNGIELTYCERGTNNSDVLICGAFTFHTFMPMVELLAEKYHVYGIIMRFDGKADELNADGSVNWSRQWGKDVYNFTSAMGLSKFHYFGKCHGSIPGWYLVKNHPECLKTFSSFFLAPHTKAPNGNQWFDVLKNHGPLEMLKAGMRKPETGIKAKTEEMSFAGKIDASIIPKYAANFTQNIWSSMEDCIATLRNMSVPVEYLFGTDDLFFQDHFDSNIFAMMNTKGARSIILSGERHFMEIDCPERIVSEVFTFIAEAAKSY